MDSFDNQIITAIEKIPFLEEQNSVTTENFIKTELQEKTLLLKDS